MFSLIISIVAIVLGYMIYGKFVEKILGPNPDTVTPAVKNADGIDYIKMPGWKVFMIQFLNIAGTGPIFGAIMGAKFGPSAYLWIVLGCIFAGAVHDYLAAMLSMRNNGANLPDIVGKYLGTNTKRVMMVFTAAMLVLVGGVFVYSPAVILGNITGDGGTAAVMIWVAVVFIYYVVATLLPIDKVIGKIYPLFAFSLLFMAVSLLVCLFVKWPSLPELWDGLGNRGPSIGMNGQSIFPCLFITIACGAISGFHGTQSPLMARCVGNEKLGRPIFYGAMITEGIVAIIWATVASYFFFDGGAEEVGLEISASAPMIVTAVSYKWLGIFGGILALLGVVAAPITSGDTALRSARLIIADALRRKQESVRSRLRISIPIFLVTAFIIWFNIAHEDGFNTIWRYFGWANQTLAVFTLWALTVFLYVRRKGARYLVTLLPACFMTSVCTSYICVEKIGFNMPDSFLPYIAVGVFFISLGLFYLWKHTRGKRFNPDAEL